VRGGEAPADAVVRLVLAMDETTLCVQGPPGTGKTTTSARAILALLEQGKRVGVTSNSHAAIENLLLRCCELARAESRDLPCLKVGGDGEGRLFEEFPSTCYAKDTGKAQPTIGGHALVGGTAWLFSHESQEARFDHLFVDEAGQVSLANVAGMVRAATNLVLVGDQMQLAQPIQGSHPGESGRSVLDHVLGGHATVPPDRGVFLDRTLRLHPALCGFLSETIYEGRLHADPVCARRVVRVPGGPSSNRIVPLEAGLLFVPVPHEGNTQASDEEVDTIRRILGELLGREQTNERGEVAGRIELNDVLVVAPYNLQVHRLREALPPGVRVGTVDRFQGQEATVVLVSMCASDGHDSPRGLAFVLDRNRLNVALSRARSLAIVVGHPGLAETHAATIEQVTLINRFARIVHEGSVPRRPGRLVPSSDSD